MRILWLAEASLPEDTSENIALFTIILDMITFLLLLISVEMPHILRWRWPAVICVIYCALRMSYDSASNIARNRQITHPSVIVLLTRLLATCYGLMLPFIPKKLSMNGIEEFELRSESLESIPVRAWFFTSYTLALMYGERLPRLGQGMWLRLGDIGWASPFKMQSYSEPATLFSALTAVAYWIAVLAGQELVYSRVLGGPGVEVMTFIRSGYALGVESIGLEEGRIRLT
ncbi:hypothetical protein F4804DRAFT_279054 [Jackrogersella minutella]|nr:hypothetical protein F4804DRAFT_279054 [Jackrogersella minutella]